jgi:hypothetical protein
MQDCHCLQTQNHDKGTPVYHAVPNHCLEKRLYVCRHLILLEQHLLVYATVLGAYHQLLLSKAVVDDDCRVCVSVSVIRAMHMRGENGLSVFMIYAKACALYSVVPSNKK